LTANAISGQREIFLQKGINDFLAKPIEIIKLDAILKKWLHPEKLVQSSRAYIDVIPGEAPDIIISGVDTVLGLRNCGGDVSAYLSILEDFRKDAENRIIQINEALAQGDIKLYITLVHALKGAARSIGAMETGKITSGLEEAASGGHFEGIRGGTADLDENVKLLINNIGGEIEKRETKENRENEEISALRLEILKTALEEMDIEAVNRLLVTFAGLSLDSRTKELISEVEQLILMFEYDKAIKKLNELR